MSSLARILGHIGVSYEIYRVFKLATPAESPDFPESPVCVRLLEDHSILGSTTPEVRGLSEYAGPGAVGFVATVNEKVVGACWYWHGARYRSRGFIKLPPTAAKLVQITVDPEYRGRGIAPVLIGRSSRIMAERGFTELYARIWHSNRSSLAAFTKAGWQDLGLVTLLNTKLRSKPFRFGAI
jgi:GNAT superfamily N-acetyltransferase